MYRKNVHVWVHLFQSSFTSTRLNLQLDDSLFISMDGHRLSAILVGAYHVDACARSLQTVPAAKEH